MTDPASASEGPAPRFRIRSDQLSGFGRNERPDSSESALKPPSRVRHYVCQAAASLPSRPRVVWPRPLWSG